MVELLLLDADSDSVQVGCRDVLGGCAIVSTAYIALESLLLVHHTFSPQYCTVLKILRLTMSGPPDAADPCPRPRTQVLLHLTAGKKAQFPELGWGNKPPEREGLH